MKKFYKNKIIVNQSIVKLLSTLIQYAIPITITQWPYDRGQCCSWPCQQLQNHRQFLQSFILSGGKIGSGSFGQAYKGISYSNPNKELVIKKSPFSTQAIIKKGHDPIKLLVDGLATIEMIKKNPHPNIVNYEFVGVEVESKNLYEVMEFCNDGDIYSHDNLTQEESLNACYQVASALVHLHSLKIIHRDVKSDNVYVDKDQYGKRTFKLADFSFSCMKTDIKTQTGNELFRAPEAFNTNSVLTNKIDIWSLGVIYYHLIFNDFPFNGKDAEMIKSSINNGFKYPKQEAQALKIHPKVQQLLEGMLESNPNNRFSAADVMKSIDKMRNVRSSIMLSAPGNYTLFDELKYLSEIKMEGGICFGGRGIAKLNNQIYVTMDRKGNVQKINRINNSIIDKKEFDVGGSNLWSSIIINNAENCLITSGYSNANIYAVNPTNLQITRMWKYSHSSYLRRVLFLDNKILCAGYMDGMLKKYSVDSEIELATFKISKFLYILSLSIDEEPICSFYADSNSTKLLVGGCDGTLCSMNWQSFTAKNWTVQVCQGKINSIYKSGSLIATGCHEKSIILFNSSKPPQVVNKIETNSAVHQVQFTANSANLLVLCCDEFLLLSINVDNLQKLCQKSKEIDFKNKDLETFALLDDNNVVVGDWGGHLFSMKLLKQAHMDGQPTCINKNILFYFFCWFKLQNIFR